MNMGDELSSQTNVNQPPIDNDFNQEEEPIMGANPFEGNQTADDCRFALQRYWKGF